MEQFTISFLIDGETKKYKVQKSDDILQEKGLLKLKAQDYQYISTNLFEEFLRVIQGQSQINLQSCPQQQKQLYFLLAVQIECLSLCQQFEQSFLEQQLQLPSNHRAKILLEILSKGFRMEKLFNRPNPLLNELFKDGMLTFRDPDCGPDSVELLKIQVKLSEEGTKIFLRLLSKKVNDHSSKRWFLRFVSSCVNLDQQDLYLTSVLGIMTLQEAESLKQYLLDFDNYRNQLIQTNVEYYKEENKKFNDKLEISRRKLMEKVQEKERLQAQLNAINSELEALNFASMLNSSQASTQQQSQASKPSQVQQPPVTQSQSLQQRNQQPQPERLQQRQSQDIDLYQPTASKLYHYEGAVCQADQKMQFACGHQICKNCLVSYIYEKGGSKTFCLSHYETKCKHEYTDQEKQRVMESL